MCNCLFLSEPMIFIGKGNSQGGSSLCQWKWWGLYLATVSKLRYSWGCSQMPEAIPSGPSVTKEADSLSGSWGTHTNREFLSQGGRGISDLRVQMRMTWKASAGRPILGIRNVPCFSLSLHFSPSALSPYNLPPGLWSVAIETTSSPLPPGILREVKMLKMREQSYAWRIKWSLGKYLQWKEKMIKSRFLNPESILEVIQSNYLI